MNNDLVTSDKKIQKLAEELAKVFSVPMEDALSVIYEEWDLVESLFLSHSKVEVIVGRLVEEINNSYRIA